MKYEDILNREFFKCAMHGNCSLGRIWLMLGADINFVDERLQFTPLHQAVARRHEEFAEMLICKPDIALSAQDKFGRTPEDIAVSGGLADLADAIRMARTRIEAKVDVPKPMNEP
jgi:ankyrin repeat protein